MSYLKCNLNFNLLSIYVNENTAKNDNESNIKHCYFIFQQKQVSSKIWATKTQQETVTLKAQSTAQDRWKLTGVPRHQFVWRSDRKPQK